MRAARPRDRHGRVYPIPCHRAGVEPGGDFRFHRACAQEHSFARLAWVLPPEGRVGKEAGRAGRGVKLIDPRRVNCGDEEMGDVKGPCCPVIPSMLFCQTLLAEFIALVGSKALDK